MTRHIFKAIKDARIPVVGDLIRSGDAGDLINIVLSVSGLITESGTLGFIPYYNVLCTRYGCTNRGNFSRRDGKRARTVTFNKPPCHSNWGIVEEYKAVENKEERLQLANNTVLAKFK